jgi:hypothetical protein
MPVNRVSRLGKFISLGLNRNRRVWDTMGMGATMTNLTIALPDDLASRLQGVAELRRTSVQQLVVEGLKSFLESGQGVRRPGSPAALLQAVSGVPHVAAEDVADLEAAIAAARIESRPHDLFPD